MSTQMAGTRGGAGNIKTSNKPQEGVKANDLSTPTIKQPTYTTGRGGAGNMASNESAESARKAQDVDAPEHHQKEMKGTYHWGRGGEGNKTTIGEDERASSKSPARNGGGARRRSSMKDQAKEMLGFGKGEKDKRQENAVAIEDD